VAFLVRKSARIYAARSVKGKFPAVTRGKYNRRHARCERGTRMKTQSAFKLTALLSLLLGALVFSGCHTMDGAGKDIEKAGEKIQDAADK
jgi:predicted small secreted protein